jgi:hypothetical protein
MEPWRSCRSVVIDSTVGDEQDPDPEPDPDPY